ncbi:MAG: hypothetical protein QG551_187 [Patescibacteria group bacterium]|jgi:D-alanyl-D-alanine carboxypeptidase|nr:hypothetical protein [Patescibacteria group bacterium]
MNLIEYKTTDELTKQEKQYLGILGTTMILAIFYFVGVTKTMSLEKLSMFLNNSDERLASQMTSNRHLESMFEELNLRASSVLVFDVFRNEVIYQKNENQKMPLASLTKVMTAVVAMEALKNTEVINIPKEALDQTGDNGLFADEKWGRDDLLKFMLITSSNDAAKAVAMTAGKILPNDAENPRKDIENFVYYMNQKSKELGFLDTYFFNESGLDVTGDENGGYGTAKEMSQLFTYATEKYPEIFNSTSYDTKTFTSLNQLPHVAHNTNQSVGKVAGISASKTGFTNISGGNLIVSFEAGLHHPIVLVVLGSTFDERFTDITQLSTATIKAINTLDS